MDDDTTHNVKGFEAKSNGIALGFERFVSKDVKLGFGYGYTKSDSTVTIANGASYIVDGHGMKRMGGEFGVGLTAEFYDAMDVTASYEGRIRQNYYDNTGMLNIKYNF